jgi:hypothetical protein
MVVTFFRYINGISKLQMTSKSITNLWLKSCVNWKIAPNIIG